MAVTLPKLPAYVPGGSSPAVAKALAALSAPKVPKSTLSPGSIPAAFGGSLVGPSLSVPSSGGGVPGSSYVPPSGGSNFNFGGDLSPQIDPSQFFAQLKNDPMYQGADQAYNAAIGSGRQSLADSIKQLVIRGGWGQQLKDQMPSGLQQYAGDIDQATIDAAASNPLSSRAQLGQQLQRQQADLAYELAGRGTLGGGGFATGNTQLQQGYDQSTNDAMNQLLDTINQGAGNFATYSANAANARDQAYAAAASRLAQMPAFGSSGMTPGGNSYDAIAAALPYDTNSVLGKAVLGTPNFDYNALDRALKIPTSDDIMNQFKTLYGW